jgi:lipopolysaccharide/colanic/teichoic acid biosynthesis glycosyltransferase
VTASAIPIPAASMDATSTTTDPPEAAPAFMALAPAPSDSLACRVLDVVLASVGLVLLAPLLALITVAIRLDSPGGAIFRQRRFGQSLQAFTINKFRTMYAGAEHDNHGHRRFVLGLISGDAKDEDRDRPFFKISADARVTRVGHLLRKSSMDELPQLWNVLRGEMSLVGPRPSLSYEVENYPAHWHGRFAVKPGLTGLWQVSGRSELTLEEMIALDLEYARTKSLWLNVKILARTVPTVLLGRGAA